MAAPIFSTRLCRLTSGSNQRGILIRLTTLINKLNFNVLFFTSKSEENGGGETKAAIFDVAQNNKRLEALRSILFVYTSNQISLLDFCQNYGKINSAFFFNRFEKQYSLIEYNDEQSVKRLVSQAIHFPNRQRIPLGSHCLFFQNNQRGRNQKRSINHSSAKIFNVENFGKSDLSDNILKNCPSIELQMRTLHRMQSMSDLDLRLRYFLAAEVERLVRRIFPESEVHLFGSSVSGLGRFNGDVDMNLVIEDVDNLLVETDSSNKSIRNNVAYFISKIRPEVDRTFSQHILEIFGTMLKNLCPQMMNVRLILRARVPIVKFMHTSTDIECDLCFGNLEALEMSEYMHRACHHHKHILPLIFTIRQWAKCNGVTKSNPGPWLSNFMLTLLVMFHLQQHQTKLLPPLKYIKSSKTNQKSGNPKEANLEYLLVDFFKFYSDFDFSRHGISVYEGDSTIKPEELVTEQTSVSEPQLLSNVQSSIINSPSSLSSSTSSSSSSAATNSSSSSLPEVSSSSSTTTTQPMPPMEKTISLKTNPLFLENPIERELNAAKNVLEPNLVHFKSCCQQAYNVLTSNTAGDDDMSKQQMLLSSSSPGLLNILSVNDDEDDDDDVISDDGASNGNASNVNRR